MTMRVTIARDKRMKVWRDKPQGKRVTMPCQTFDERIIAGRTIITSLRLRP